MKIQKISNQNFGVTILSDKIQDTLYKEREKIGRFWGEYSPQYDYLYQIQQEIDSIIGDGVLDLRERGEDFSLLLLRRQDKAPIVRTFKNKTLGSKLILDFLKMFK